jgi:hypothetical protein
MPFDTSMYSNYAEGSRRNLSDLVSGIQGAANTYLQAKNQERQNEFQAKQQALQEQAAQRQQQAFETEQADAQRKRTNELFQTVGQTATNLMSIQDPQAQQAEWLKSRQGLVNAGLAKPQELPESFEAAKPMVSFYHAKHQQAQAAEALKTSKEKAEIYKLNADARRKDSGGDPVAQALAMERLKKFETDRQEKELGLAVPGYRRTGEVMPKAEEAMKLRKATGDAEQLVTKLGRLKDLVSENGSFEYGGEGGTEMESLATEIQLLAKGDNMYQLGVLTGPDMRLLEKITSDPSSLGSFFTRDSTRQKQIDTQLKSIKEKLASVTKASGYAKADSGGKRTVVDRMINKRTGQTKLVYSDGSEEISNSNVAGR